MNKIIFLTLNMGRSAMLLFMLLLANSAWGQQNWLPSHPRLLFTKIDEVNVKLLIQKDSLASALAAFTKAKADSLVNTPQIAYENARDNYGQMLPTARAYVQRLTALSLAYRIYGNVKYRDAVNAALLCVCNYPEWRPNVFLDTAEMTTAIAIAYDWLYDVLPQSTKDLVKNTIYERNTQAALYEYEKGSTGSWAKRETNWNVVCNTSAVLGALAIAEDYPKETEIILQNAAKYLPNCLKHFAPDGVCYESPCYWGYTTSYLSLYLKAVTDNGGDKAEIGNMAGLSRTAMFYKRALTPSGQRFDYANSHAEEAINAPVFFLFSRLYHQPEIAAWYRNELSRIIQSNEVLHQLFFLALPWFDDSRIDKIDEIPSLEVFHNSINDLIIFNGDRNKKGSVYLIAKGGEPQQAHQQMDCGTFIIESDSVRWTEELCSEDYGVPGFWDQRVGGERWKYFRNNNFSHNTISIDHNLQYAPGKAFVCEEDTKNTQPYATLDMTSLYNDLATSVYRKFTLIDDFTVEVEDKVELINPQSVISWIAGTKANVEVKGNEIHLTKDEKDFYMQILSPADAVFKTYPAQNKYEGEYPIVGVTMIEAECTLGQTKGEVVVRMSSIKLK